MIPWATWYFSWRAVASSFSLSDWRLGETLRVRCGTIGKDGALMFVGAFLTWGPGGLERRGL
jgi:hypothetical protein